ncbi:motility twitching protein PilT [Bacteroidia bacterium]|nr:motility twitching protein PilT [Bacteroidia bacterium]
MNGIRILCDTNSLIYLLDGNRDVANFLDNKQIYVSVISELELFGKPHLLPREIRVIENLLESCFVVNINPDIKMLYRQLRQEQNLRLADAVVAATAIYLDVPLLTFDKDFKNMMQLNLLLWNK